MRKLIEWFKESNHWAHFWIAALCGMLSFAFVVGLASGMEFKDVAHRSNTALPFRKWAWSYWSWGDWFATVLGGLLALVLKLLTFALISSICH